MMKTVRWQVRVESWSGHGHLFVSGCAGSGFSLAAASRVNSSLQCTSFSLQWPLLSRAQALGGAWVSVVGGLSSCGSGLRAQAQ